MLLNPALVAAAALVWLCALFAVALYGERRAQRFARIWPLVYVLSLGVYCTAWTFYGTVTQATRWGAWLPPTFIGTIVLFALGTPFLARLAKVARAENAATLADLVASRYGKHAGLAATITAVAVLGMVPYVALQLKAVAMGYAMLTGGVADAPAWRDAAFWVAVTMAAFAMLFGTRRAAATEHNRGLVLAIAFESVFKLAAMLLLGAWVVWGTHDGIAALAARAASLPPASVDGAYVALAGLGALAMFTLPHQFHVGTVELSGPRDLGAARWGFPLYLVLIALPILPLAWAGQLALGDSTPSDLYVLGLPLAAGRNDLALLTFLGGASAASGMAILAAITLSLMIANHWLAPWLVRDAAQRGTRDLRGIVLAHRRAGIALVLALAFGYSRAMGSSEALADIGALSFAALAQLAPAVIGAVYWPGPHARAVLAGLVTGAVVWAWLSLAPVAASAGLVSFAPWPEALSWLTPDGFLGLTAWDPLARGVVVSLALNVIVTLAVARAAAAPARAAPGSLTVAALGTLASRFVPRAQLDALLAARDPEALADAAQIARVERELAPVIGAASARLLVDAAQRGSSAPLDTVAALVGEASQALRFNQRLLEAALENMSQGISVVGPGLELVAWNRRYAELFDYPAGMLGVGVPIAALLRRNLAADFPTPAALEREVGKRLAHMRAGTPYVTQRRFGPAIVEIRGNPMPGGGFVATFTDVTAFHLAESGLRELATTLEQRVAQRTAESEAARAEAEQANRAKTRFLAAVGHDLLQPINAAHLFTHALAQKTRGRAFFDEVAQIDGALSSAEALLASLLDISRLDAGGMTAQVEPFRVGELLRHLAAEFGVLARERGLELRFVDSTAWVASDPQLLRRVLSNFLANAIRYTERGKVLIGCRRRGAALAIEVWDTGPGIAAKDSRAIFEEFRRLDRGGSGLGLGLAIAERIARLLEHPITLRSALGRGTAFGVVVPLASARATAPPSVARAPRTPRSRVLVVDNDPSVRRGMQALLAGWHCDVDTAHGPVDAEAAALRDRPDLLLVDYHLDDGATGLGLHARITERIGALPCIVVTADHGEAVREAVHDAGAHLLLKPLKPLALKSLMARLLAARTRAAS